MYPRANQSPQSISLLGAIWSEGSLRILRETFVVIVFMWVHWHCREVGCEVCWITMLFLDVFIKMLFPKHLNPAGERTPHWNIWTWFRYFVVLQIFCPWPWFPNRLTPINNLGFQQLVLQQWEIFCRLVGWLGLWATFRFFFSFVSMSR